MSDLVENLEDMFSHEAAQLSISLVWSSLHGDVSMTVTPARFSIRNLWTCAESFFTRQVKTFSSCVYNNDTDHYKFCKTVSGY